MKIGIDCRILGRRGVGRYLSNLLRALAAEKSPHEFYLFLGPKSRRDEVPRAPKFFTVDLGNGHPAYLEQVGIPLLALENKLDLMHCPDNTGPLVSTVPYVLTMHDTMWRRPLKASIGLPTVNQRLQDVYRKWVCPRAARQARHVVTITEFSRQDILRTLRLDPKKVSVVPEGLDPFFLKPLPLAKAKTVVETLGLRSPFILCSGASDKRKNIDRLIQAFARAREESPALAHARLVVTSMGSQELATTTYASTAWKCGVVDWVHYLGYVSDEQLKALYQRALCFAFPSLWEGFGLPVLEAFALSCPVLASKRTAIPETAGQGALLVDPESVEALADGLIKASARAFRKSAVPRGMRELKRFSWSLAAKRTLKIYESAARQGT